MAPPTVATEPARRGLQLEVLEGAPARRFCGARWGWDRRYRGYEPAAVTQDPGGLQSQAARRRQIPPCWSHDWMIQNVWLCYVSRIQSRARAARARPPLQTSIRSFLPFKVKHPVRRGACLTWPRAPRAAQTRVLCLTEAFRCVHVERRSCSKHARADAAGRSFPEAARRCCSSRRGERCWSGGAQSKPLLGFSSSALFFESFGGGTAACK